MLWQAWVVIGILILVLYLLSFTRIGPDLIMIGALTLLLVTGISQPADALIGFANEGVLAVAVLFVVVAGLRKTGAISLLGRFIQGKPKSLVQAQARVMLPTAFLSAFVNNTPVVALMMPAVNDWAKKNRLSPAKLMIPLSYASILGGICTLIGTSTNLVVNGLLKSQTQHDGIGLFDLAWVGIPCALAGLIYLLFFGRFLPDRHRAISDLDDPREYTVEMVVEPGSSLVGKSIDEAELRQLPGLFLVEIDRQGEVLQAVAPSEKLQGNDQLIFAGIVESVVDLQTIRGLRPATDQVFKLNSPRTHRCLLEAVVSNSCPLVGKTIREGRFRTYYNAAVIAVCRNGVRLRQKIGDIILEAGDTLLLEAGTQFLEQQRNSRDFFLVSMIEDSSPPRHERMWIALAILAGMVASVALGLLNLLAAALLAAVLMILTRCCRGTDARRSIDIQLLVTMAGSFGIGRALQTSGADAILASSLLGLGGESPWLILTIIFAITTLFTESISNNTAALLVFPIALRAATSLGVSIMPFVIIIMIAASCGFATPIGYQTNLMVYGPGRYRFSDFLWFGGPLKMVVGAIAILLTP